MTEITHDELEAAVAELAERAGTHPITVTEDALPKTAPEPSPETDPIVPPQMTKKVWKEMMRIHFTVRRPLVKSCGHKINTQSDPRNNCESCWYAYFNNNKTMTEIADDCFRNAGRDVLERSRGKRFTKMFLRFMSTINRLVQEAAQKEENAPILES